MTFQLRLLCLFLLMISTLDLQSQNIAQTRTLRGAVVDPSGAVIPCAHITLTGQPDAVTRYWAIRNSHGWQSRRHAPGQFLVLKRMYVIRSQWKL